MNPLNWFKFDQIYAFYIIFIYRRHQHIQIPHWFSRGPLQRRMILWFLWRQLPPIHLSLLLLRLLDCCVQLGFHHIHHCSLGPYNLYVICKLHAICILQLPSPINRFMRLGWLVEEENLPLAAQNSPSIMFFDLLTNQRREGIFLIFEGLWI